LYLKDLPHILDNKTIGFHENWNLSFGYGRKGYWLGAYLPKPAFRDYDIDFGNIYIEI